MKSRKTTSAVLEAVGKISFKEFEIPEVKNDDAILKVEMVGVCGSDVGIYTGKTGRILEHLPIILGHEFVGHIIEAGDVFCKQHGVEIGDRVLVEYTFGCGMCRSCISGNYRLCEKKYRYGTYISSNIPPHLWGGYGEHVYLAPRAMVHKISSNVPPEEAILISAVLGNGIRWINQIGRTKIGDVVAIIGPGPQGLAAVVAAKESGASKIIVTGLTKDKKRLDMATLLGATHTIDVSKDDPIKVTKEMTGGRLANVVIDVSGTEPGINTAIDLVAQEGTLVMPGMYGTGKKIAIELDKLILNETRVMGAYSHDYRSVEPAIALVESRKYPLSKMVTHKFPLSKAEEAIKVMGGFIEGEDAIKVVLDPWM